MAFLLFAYLCAWRTVVWNFFASSNFGLFGRYGIVLVFSHYFNVLRSKEYSGLCHTLACCKFAREENYRLGQQEEPV